MLVGKPAPLFSCEAVIDGQIKTVSLEDYLTGTIVLFFYPLDFSFVCPTELHAFQDDIDEFKKRNTSVLGISVDSVYSHLAWLAQPKVEGGISGITYPIFSDITKSISRLYHVLDEEAGIAYRALFIIDKQGIVQSTQINNLSLGRNIKEVLRLVDAIEFVSVHGEVCPANWMLGQEALTADHKGVVEYFQEKK